MFVLFLSWIGVFFKTIFAYFNFFRIFSRLHAQHWARHGAQSHDPGIINWAKTKSQRLNQLSHPSTLWTFFGKLFQYQWRYMIFLLKLLKWSIILIDPNTEPSLHSWNKSHRIMTYYLIITTILFSTFVSIFLRGIDL